MYINILKYKQNLFISVLVVFLFVRRSCKTKIARLKENTESNKIILSSKWMVLKSIGDFIFIRKDKSSNKCNGEDTCEVASLWLITKSDIGNIKWRA